MASSLAARLAGDVRRPTVTAFPDGSVDRFYEVYDGDRRIHRREAFAEAIGTGRTSEFHLQCSASEPGGHAVNMASQAHALGDDVTLVGHLDDPVFSDLPFETYSMGDPARVAIYGFEDGDVMTVDPSRDIEEWSFDALRAATGEAFESLLSADVVFCTNWTTFDLQEVVAELAATGVDGDWFVIDPGEVARHSDPEVRGLLGALADLADSWDVVLAANGEEVRSLAGAVVEDPGSSGGDGNGDVEHLLDRIRGAGNLAAAVCHEEEAAVAVTPERRIRVENFDVDPVRNTGGGDRFDAGLSHALARDWSWDDALRLGNACASRYVATGETATRDELAAFLRERGPA